MGWFRCGGLSTKVCAHHSIDVKFYFSCVNLRIARQILHLDSNRKCIWIVYQVGSFKLSLDHLFYGYYSACSVENTKSHRKSCKDYGIHQQAAKTCNL